VLAQGKSIAGLQSAVLAQSKSITTLQSTIQTQDAKIDRVEKSLTSSIDRVEKSLTSSIDRVERELTSSIQEVGEAVQTLARIWMNDLRKRIAKMNTRFEEAKRDTNHRFDLVDRKLFAMDNRSDQMENRQPAQVNALVDELEVLNVLPGKSAKKIRAVAG